jgi:hypothetical protein
MVRPEGPETAGPQAAPRRMRENYGFFSASASFGASALKARFSLILSPYHHYGAASATNSLLVCWIITWLIPATRDSKQTNRRIRTSATTYTNR